jgi:hypothetical protein
MGSLPPRDDALHAAGDLVALARGLYEALKAGQRGYASVQAGRLAARAAALRLRLIGEECGFEHVGVLAERELERLREPL